MSKSAIEEKLIRQLSSDEPFTEVRLVYILVEIRKLMEREKALKKLRPPKLMDDREKYEASKAKRLESQLSFFCDWAAHAEMTREGAKRMLKLFDAAHPILCRDEDLPTTLKNQIENLINLRLFEKAIIKFLSARSLPADKLRSRWPEVMRSYAAIIEDCPMKGEAEHLKNIKSVTVKKEEGERTIAVGDETHVPFRIRWCCCGHDGSEGTMDSYNTVAI